MRRLVFVLVGLSGCTYGGSSEDPLEGLDPGQAIAALDGGASTMGDAASPGNPAKDGAASSSADAGRRSDAMTANASCEPAMPFATCDPVHNEGCLFTLLVGLPTQCDVDTKAATPTGRCILRGLSTDPMCSSDDLSTSCDAQSTCVNGSCKRVCYCNDDCGAGACCTDTSANIGSLRYCQPC